MTAVYLGCVVLGVLATLAVAVATPPQPARRTLTWTLALATGWAAADLASNLATTPAQMRVIAVLAAPVWALLPFAVLRAALRYSGKTWPGRQTLVYGALLLPGLGAAALEVAGLLHSAHVPAQVAGPYFDSIATPWQHAVTAYFLVYALAAGTVLAKPGDPRQPIELRTTATAILGGVLPASVIGGFANAGGVLQGWRPPYLGSVAAVGIGVGIAVAILKRHIFEPLEHAQSAREEAEARYRTLVELSPDAVLVTDRAGRVTSANGRVATMLGYPTVDALVAAGDDLVSWMRPEDQPVGRAALQRIVDGHVQQDARTLIRSRSGELVSLAISGAPFADRSGRTTHVLWSAQDLTQVEEAAARRRRLEGEVARAQRLESLGVLVGGIAHDFNNLLAGILGNAELAREDVPADHAAQESLEQIVIASERAADLVRAMLAYAGRGQLEVRPLDVSALMREIAELLAVSTSKKVTLRCDLPAGLPRVHGDPGQLQQIVMNLIRNAAEAVGDEVGEVTVAASAVRIDDDGPVDVVTGAPMAPGRYVAVEVSDTGPGIPPAVLPRIFEPFFSTKASGRGLGLSATLGIVRTHRGALVIENRPGAGATFRVLLPAGEPAPAAPAPAATPAPVAGERPAPRQQDAKTILVVDDEEAVRRVARYALERAGFLVLTANDGLEAVAVYEREAQRLDLVLLDLTMPGLSGQEVLDRIRARDARLPVILASGYGEIPARDAATRFLGKPFPPATLVAVVDEALGQAGPAGPIGPRDATVTLLALAALPAP